MKTMLLVAPYSVYCVLLYMIPFVCKCTCISSSSGNVKLIIVEFLIEDVFFPIDSGDMYLKDQSHPSISNVKSADVRLATGLGTVKSLASITNCV